MLGEELTVLWAEIKSSWSFLFKFFSSGLLPRNLSFNLEVDTMLTGLLDLSRYFWARSGVKVEDEGSGELTLHKNNFFLLNKLVLKIKLY